MQDHNLRVFWPSVRTTRFSSTGSYRNLACSLKGVQVLAILNLDRKPMTMSLASIKAKYLPMQLLCPAENGMKEYGSELQSVLSFHRSGSKTSGLLQYLGLCISPMMLVPTKVPSEIQYGPSFMFYLATRRRIPTAGGHILRHSSRNLPKYSSFYITKKVRSSALLINWLISSMTFCLHSGYSARAKSAIDMRWPVVSMPAKQNEISCWTIYSLVIRLSLWAFPYFSAYAIFASISFIWVMQSQMKSLSGFCSSLMRFSIISNKITLIQSIRLSKSLSALLKFIFVTFYLKNSSMMMFSPVLDLLNMSVVKSARANASLRPLTYLPMAYSEKKIRTRISPIINSFSCTTPKTRDLVGLWRTSSRTLPRKLLMLWFMIGIIFFRASWLKLCLTMAFWPDQSQPSTRKMPFVQDLCECLNRLNFLKLRALVEISLMSLAEQTTSIGLYPRLVRQPLTSGSCLTRSLAKR